MAQLDRSGLPGFLATSLAEQLEIRSFSAGSAEHSEAISLRARVLREPLRLTLTAEEISRDYDDVHLGAFLDGRMVGTLILTRLDASTAQMRQVAVDPSVQGLGVGKALLAEFEKLVKKSLFVKVILEARQTAIPFYDAHGYEAFGDVFIKSTVPHRKMQKSFQP